MCLFQGDSYSNSRYFSRFHMQRFVNTHPCGHCAECIQQKRSEWYLRNYWQALECVREGFFVSEALTYEDGHLPHVNDFFPELNDFIRSIPFEVPRQGDGKVFVNFSCVDKRGVQKFLDRLHHNLKRRYFGADFGIKHFICAEYGHDDVYYDDYGRPQVGTIRPHYHCVFYVMHPVRRVYCHVKTKRTKRVKQFCAMLGIAPEDIQLNTTYHAVVRLTPEDFIKEVAEAWQNGNTQNYKRYECSGVLKQEPCFSPNYRKYVFDSVGKADSDLRAMTNYITKYITKGDDYSARLGQRAAAAAKQIAASRVLKDRLGFSGSSEKELYREALKMVKDRIGLFHLQSDGLGKYYLDSMDEEARELAEKEGCLRIGDAKDVARLVPLPMYYIRKLFYRYRKYEDSDGVHVQWYLTDYGKEQMKTLTYRKIARQASKYADIYANMPDMLKEEIDSKMAGRTLEDLLTYSLVYKGRVVYSGYSATDDLPTVEDIIDIQSDYNAADAGTRDYENSGHFLVSRQEVDLRPVFGGDEVDVFHRAEKKSRFVRRWCINQDTLFGGVRPFRDFDFVLSRFATFRMEKNQEDERVFRSLERLRTVYKYL